MSRAAQSLAAAAERSAASGPGWLRQLRRRALDRFAGSGLPTTRVEEWRFTSLSALAPLELAPADPAASLDGTELRRLAGRPGGHRLVFVNGRYRAELSQVGALPSGVFAGSLAEALATRPELLEGHLGRQASIERHPFVALATAGIDDGAVLVLPEGGAVEEPIEIVFVTAGATAPVVVFPRVLVVAGPDSEATVVEAHLGSGGVPTLTAAVSEISLAEGARIDHYKLQDEALDAFHVGLLASHQDRESRFSTHQTTLGAALSRSEVAAVLGGEGAEVAVSGLYMVAGTQLVDNHSVIEHAVPRCQSREVFKGILDGKAHAVFGGRIRVLQGAQKSDAHQLNSNLLLSDDAVVDTMPQLEIFADDVKCGHGGTVGQLDEAQLFYLQSRGIPRRSARAMLVYAFAAEMVRSIRPTALRERIGRRVAARLPEGEKLREAA